MNNHCEEGRDEGLGQEGHREEGRDQAPVKAQKAATRPGEEGRPKRPRTKAPVKKATVKKARRRPGEEGCRQGSGRDEGYR